MQLEGTIRNLGVHACGIIIGKVPISDIVPTWVTTDSDTKEEIQVTQYEGSVIESTGLIKMDLASNVSIIREAIKNIKARHGVEVDIDNISLEDELTFKLFQEGKRTPYSSSSRSCKSRSYSYSPHAEDLIAMVAPHAQGLWITFLPL